MSYSFAREIQTYKDFKKVISEDTYSIIIYWYPPDQDACTVRETIAEEFHVLRNKIFFINLDGGSRFYDKDPLRDGINNLLVVRIYRSGQLLDEVKGYNPDKMNYILENIQYELEPTTNPYWALSRPHLDPDNFVAYPQ
ncbi:hypothetical protein BOTBODRAFT_33858 [Botryobasidium botryosum FD-172 SS1]|uniref:Thioredoxin domain-containing protein n=1 Tax=Botryobasidium botryosum (strain FD-172 SS1) TaxID=930990 RepID=A0A067MEW3_BOTB1|nr:hypothetical protein BOTBODRAFT_33858 [Botryobasidium botryosum FD-172 SS1]